MNIKSLRCHYSTSATSFMQLIITTVTNLFFPLSYLQTFHHLYSHIHPQYFFYKKFTCLTKKYNTDCFSLHGFIYILSLNTLLPGWLNLISREYLTGHKQLHFKSIKGKYVSPWLKSYIYKPCTQYRKAALPLARRKIMKPTTINLVVTH